MIGIVASCLEMVRIVDPAALRAVRSVGRVELCRVKEPQSFV